MMEGCGYNRADFAQVNLLPAAEDYRDFLDEVCGGEHQWVVGAAVLTIFVEGSANELGKTTGKDAAGAKPTYPALFGLDRARVMAAECAERARTILTEARLNDGWLDAIADWVLTRKN